MTDAGPEANIQRKRISVKTEKDIKNKRTAAHFKFKSIFPTFCFCHNSNAKSAYQQPLHLIQREMLKERRKMHPYLLQ